MTRSNHLETTPADILEFEAATKRALKAMRTGDSLRMARAFDRYLAIYTKMGQKPYEQVVADARCLENRGRIDLDDWQRIWAAMEVFSDELDRAAQAKGLPIMAGTVATLQ